MAVYLKGGRILRETKEGEKDLDYRTRELIHHGLLGFAVSVWLSPYSRSTYSIRPDTQVGDTKRRGTCGFFGPSPLSTSPAHTWFRVTENGLGDHLLFLPSSPLQAVGFV